VRGVISVDISNWKKPGNKTTTKPAEQCTADEIAAEAWAQLVAHLHATADPLADIDEIDWMLDPSIVFPIVTNLEPLLINIAGSWKDRPEATTEIPNLFLASDYVRTNVDLATMEGANEAGRRAVNGILAASGSSAPACGVWAFPEPIVFQPLKELDEKLFKLGLPHIGFSRLNKLKGVMSFFGL
jgi:uncharacterized protein with NAD-binding domain and iron-sulfur cluster